MSRLGDRASYLALRAVLAGVRVLPRPLARAIGAALGRSARTLGMRRAVTDQNLAWAFPDASPNERLRIARGVYAHFGRMAVDSLRLSASGPSAVVPYVDGAGIVRILHDCLAAGRGVIILTGHIGNWELAGAFVAASGIPVAAVVKPPSNPAVAAHTERTRQALGITTIPLPEARAAVPPLLRANRAVALVADQGAARSSIWSPFFGRPTQTPVGPGLFAAETGAPIVFGALVADGERYRLEAEILDVDRSGDTGAVVQRVADAYRARLEGVVRRMPEQYLWTHRLWKRQPPEGLPASR